MEKIVAQVKWYVLTILVGCSAPRVITFVNEQADFASYESFRVVNPTSEKDDFSQEAQETLDRLEAAIINEMEQRKYYVAHASDLIVYYRILIDQQTDYHMDNYPSRYDYYSGYSYYQVRKDQYDQGTLLIDLKDAGSRKLVWQGTLDLKVKDRSKVTKEEIVEHTIAMIFAEYPYEAGRSDPVIQVDN